MTLVSHVYYMTMKQEQYNSFNLTNLLGTEILLANGDELNLNLPKFARPL